MRAQIQPGGAPRRIVYLNAGQRHFGSIQEAVALPPPIDVGRALFWLCFQVRKTDCEMKRRIQLHFSLKKVSAALKRNRDNMPQTIVIMRRVIRKTKICFLFALLRVCEKPRNTVKLKHTISPACFLCRN